MNSIFKIFVFACTLLLAQAASAQDSIIFVGNGKWHDANRWSGGVVPSSTIISTDVIIIDGTCTELPASGLTIFGRLTVLNKLTDPRPIEVRSGGSVVINGVLDVGSIKLDPGSTLFVLNNADIELSSLDTSQGNFIKMVGGKVECNNVQL